MPKSALFSQVLELNSLHQPVAFRTAGEVFCLFYKGAVKAIEYAENDDGAPVVADILDWKRWVKLPHVSSEKHVQTKNGLLRVPSTVIDKNNQFMGKVQLKLDLLGVFIRDKGIDQYTGLPVPWEFATIDHIIPRSKGGKTEWPNVALCHFNTNQLKRDRTPEEAGMTLIRKPKFPGLVPKSATLRNPTACKRIDMWLPHGNYCRSLVDVG